MSLISKLRIGVTSLFASTAPQHFPVGVCTHTVSGQLKLSGRTADVKDSTAINGELKSKDVEFSSLVEVNGQASCQNCTFKDDVLIRGTPILSGCNFNRSLEVFAWKTSLDNCNVNTLYVTYPFAATSLTWFFVQKVYLTNKTLVSTIIFDKPGGRVYCSKGSKVNQVVNGTVQ